MGLEIIKEFNFFGLRAEKQKKTRLKAGSNYLGK